MVIDLAILALIGCLVELLGIYLFNAMLTATMITSAVSLLMMLISTTRWGYKGLIIAPLLALATIISGRFLMFTLNLRHCMIGNYILSF